ncbi:ceramide synthase 4-like [Pantherophis guttatus]|uniref:Ceramide synthase 4-like n=1 Tax=Pantherophis guttatus TaxID=94885 RepID=A0ABM3ZD46_PANGU|nr:ceramide synthase 4-like [Pantherophis guttatus]
MSPRNGKPEQAIPGLPFREGKIHHHHVSHQLRSGMAEHWVNTPLGCELPGMPPDLPSAEKQRPDQAETAEHRSEALCPCSEAGWHIPSPAELHPPPTSREYPSTFPNGADKIAARGPSSGESNGGSMMAQLKQWIWRHEYWLPPGLTWEDMQETEDAHYPQPHHLLLGLPISLLMVALRFFFERKISIPLSKKLRLQEKVRRKPSPNPILEAFYRKWRKNPQQEEVNSLAKQCDLQPRQVERWFRYRLNQDRPSLTKEFCEASLGTIYYFLSFFMGLVILYNKPWFWDIRECWVGYPKQPLQPSLIGYYLMQFSFYCFLVISLPFDDRQKDFYQHIVHHFVTIILIGLSYCLNYIRIGSLILFLTDFSHCFLMSTKLFSCLKWRKACDTSFLLFAAVFMFIHLVIFPSKYVSGIYVKMVGLGWPNCSAIWTFFFFVDTLHTSQFVIATNK